MNQNKNKVDLNLVKLIFAGLLSTRRKSNYTKLHTGRNREFGFQFLDGQKNYNNFDQL